MSGGTYKQAFAISAVICLVLAGTLAYVIWGRGRVAPATDDENPVMARGPDVPERSSGSAAPSSGASVSLTPVQLSPQRMQAIGVKTAVVEMRSVSNELRVPGNVEMNERQRAYVQTRFPGWIQKVFANATYQYVRKGEPLFTIYSPDLVTTEQDYLNGLENEKLLRASTVSGVASEAQDVSAASEIRLRQWDVAARDIAKLKQTGALIPDLVMDS